MHIHANIIISFHKITGVGEAGNYMTYGKVLTGTTGATLAATGVSLGYTWAVVASLLFVACSILAIRILFRRGM